MKRTTSALPGSRIVILQTLMVVAILVVIGRFFQAAILNHNKAAAAAQSQYSVKETIQAKRGKIFFRDLNGGSNFPVALNIDSFSVVADPFLIKEPAVTAAVLSSVLQLSIDELLPKLADQHKRFVILKKKLSQEESATVDKLNLKGITGLKVPARYYPESSLAAQTIGFVDREGEGQYGIERFFNEDLKGYDGSLVGEKDAKRRLIAEGNSARAKNGADLVLTIDHNIEYVLEQELKDAIEKYAADSGSAIVLEVKTGAILALVNEPTFDLNNYNQVPTDQQSVFLNKAISAPWEPGSIFKVITLSAALDQGLIEPDTVLDLGCTVSVSGFEIHNAQDKCYNHPTVMQVLSQSINLGTVAVAEKLGNENFFNAINNFGFGSKSGVELQSESNGKVQPLKDWRDVTRATNSFGQGISVTPLQMVTAYAAVANGGLLMKPYIVAKRVESDGRVVESQPKVIRQVVKPETAAKATTLLKDVVTEGHGKRAAVPGYKIAGKTGTAQVVGADGKYEANAHIGSFVGFFPADEPKFAMLIKLDKPKNVDFAESSAAPTFGNVAKWLLHYAKVPPSEPTE